MLLDAHAHLDNYDDDQIDFIIKEINQYRIFSISVSMNPRSYEKNLRIAEKSELILPAFGIHPWQAQEYIGKPVSFRPLIEQCPMIGEIGLDYKFVEDEASYPAQKAIFEFFLMEARAQNKIVNLHTAGAENEVLKLLRLHGLSRAIIHWYSGPLELVEKYLVGDIYFTIGVEVLFSSHIQNLCKIIPDNLLLTETDNPGGHSWLTKTPGMPLLLKDVVNKIAALKNTTSSEIEALVWRNFMTLIENDLHIHLEPSQLK